MEQTPVASLPVSDIRPMNAHASADDLAGMVDGRLPSARRATVEAHLAVCADCRAELVSASAIVESVPLPRARRTKWVGPGILAAAAAVVAILIVPRATHHDAPRTVDDLAHRGSSTTGIALVEPASRVGVPRDSIRFTWRAELGASYRLVVTDSVGVLLFNPTTTDTSVIPPANLRLVPGARYLWYVEALRPDGSSSGTLPSSFSVRGR
jgi:hypothetical protein